MSDLFDVGHVAQLHEIQKARLRRGKRGIGPEVQELICRLTSCGVAGKSDDPRVAQVKRLFDIGVGRVLGFRYFAEYLATIPEIPEALRADDPNFPYLVLEEPRIGLKRLCNLGGIVFHGGRGTFVPRSDAYRDPISPVWIRIQDGRQNRGRSVDDCCRTFVAGELGLTALQGVSAYIQHPEVIADTAGVDGYHIMDLPGSVRGVPEMHIPDDVAHLSMHYAEDGRAMLNSGYRDKAVPRMGSASCRKEA